MIPLDIYNVSKNLSLKIYIKAYQNLNYILNNFFILRLINSYIFIFALLTFFIGMISILLLTNIFIQNNIKMTTTLIIMGYKNITITNIFMFVYLPIILLSFGTMFGAVYLVLIYLKNIVFNAINIIGTPNYSIIIIFIIFIAILIIYFLSYYVSYHFIKKTSIVKRINS